MYIYPFNLNISWNFNQLIWANDATWSHAWKPHTVTSTHHYRQSDPKKHISKEFPLKLKSSLCVWSSVCKHIEAWIKWLTFWRWHFQVHFVVCKIIVFWLNFSLTFVWKGSVNVKSVLVQVMAHVWSLAITFNQCWPKFMLSYGVTRTCWVDK